MYPFFESIAILNNHIQNLDLHQSRVNQTFFNYYPKQKPHELISLISINTKSSSPLIKVKFKYNANRSKIEYTEYSTIIHNQFLLYEIPELQYHYKYSDRILFNYFDVPAAHQSEIIFIKNGFITDSRYSNLIFHDGYQWIIPEHTLLNGTQRKFCMENNKFNISKIHHSQLNSFKEFKLINAMNNFQNAANYSISLINPQVFRL